MYKVKFGGKKGKTVTLEESPDLVAIRTKGNKKLEDLNLSRNTEELVSGTEEVAKFPEAGITVRRIGDSLAPPVGDGFESFGSGKQEVSGPPDTSQRDAARTALKNEDDIRFAGRVLQDKDSGEVMLYTENFFVKFLDTVSEETCQKIIAQYHLVVKNKLAFANNSYFVSASEGTGLEVFNIAEKILNEKEVEFCHPELVQERRFKLIHPKQWHLAPTTINGKPIDAHVNIQSAWLKTKGKGVTIAVVDDGIDMDHPEFAGRIVHPFDATMNNLDARPKTDNDNHGTACAGMACASGLQNGASGTAPEAFLMPIRLQSGLGSMAEANAFAWAADHGADVISCSWGPTDGEWWNPADPTHNRLTVLPDSTRLAMQYALTKGRGGKGCTILFAAGNGNEATENDGYVSYPGVISVGACNDTGKRSVYSDFGEAVWVSFPSGDFAWKPFQHPSPLSEGLRTTDRSVKPGYTTDNYTNSFGGTSGACPGMAGVVALMIAVNPDLTSAEVKNLVRKSCVVIDQDGGEYDSNQHSIYYGFGRIDAGLAVQNAQKQATNTEQGLDGAVRFSGIGEISLQNGILLGNVTPVRRVLGLQLRVHPAMKDLKVRYKINVPGLGIVENASEGVYVGTATSRQRIIGMAISLEGNTAKDYDVEYAARLKGQTQLSTGKNGVFCGSEKKSGKTIEAVSITLKKK